MAWWRQNDGPDYGGYVKKQDGFREEVEPVIKAAGIERDLQRLDDRLVDSRMWADFSGNHPPRFTDAGRKLSDEQDEEDSKLFHFGLRRIIFGVKDEDPTEEADRLLSQA